MSDKYYSLGRRFVWHYRQGKILRKDVFAWRGTGKTRKRVKIGTKMLRDKDGNLLREPPVAVQVPILRVQIADNNKYNCKELEQIRVMNAIRQSLKIKHPRKLGPKQA